MVVRLAIAGFLLAHAAIHIGFISPRPPVTAGGPAWPFDVGHSWILGPLGLDETTSRALAIALIAVILGGFALAGIAAIGIAPAGLWPAAVTIGGVASIAVLVLFFHPWLLLGIAIDVVLLWAVNVAYWAPEGVSP
jgi:hypothetical protein